MKKDNQSSNKSLWMERDWTEEIVIFVIGTIALTIISQWDLSVSPAITPGSDIVSGIAGGLVGYLTKSVKRLTG